MLFKVSMQNVLLKRLALKYFRKSEINERLTKNSKKKNDFGDRIKKIILGGKT